MKTELRIFFAGDFCSKPSTSKITVSEDLKDLVQSCDFRVVNFEVPLKPEEVNLPQQKRERFFQNDDTPFFLRELGFNLFSIANNHAFDWGEDGFLKTKSALGDDSFGAGSYNDAYKVKVVEKDGIKVGFMALCFAAYTGVFDDVANRNGLGCAYINDLRVNHEIIEAKKHVDYLFILPHDGIEYIDVPMPETIARYRDFIDYGADGVIGTHPHCPQGWENYKGKPIFYSLGNFLFNSKDDYGFHAKQPHWDEGLCAVISITDGKISWRVVNTRYVDNISIIIDYDEKRSLINRQLCLYLEDDAAYNYYLQPILEQQAESDFQCIKPMFQPSTLKEVFKSFVNCLRSKKAPSKDELFFMLRNDLKRNRFIRVLEKNKYKYNDKAN